MISWIVSWNLEHGPIGNRYVAVFHATRPANADRVAVHHNNGNDVPLQLATYGLVLWP